MFGLVWAYIVGEDRRHRGRRLNVGVFPVLTKEQILPKLYDLAAAIYAAPCLEAPCPSPRRVFQRGTGRYFPFSADQGIWLPFTSRLMIQVMWVLVRFTTVVPPSPSTIYGGPGSL